MSAFVLFSLIGLFILGLIHVSRMANKLHAMPRATRSEEIFRVFSAFDLTCLVVFGPFVVAINRIIRKVRNH